MHLKLKVNKKDSLDSGQKHLNRKSQNMASSLVNDDEDNATSTTRNTQQQQQQNNNNTSNSNSSSTNCLNQQQNNNTTITTKMHGNEAKLKKENLQQRKQDLEKLLNEKSWLLQQLQKQETEILNGNFEYMNFNDFISDLAVQYKQEQTTDAGSTAGGVSQLSANEAAILRRKPLTAKENHQQQLQQQQQQQHNVIHRRQSEISNRSSEYDNYPHHDTLSTHSDGATSSAGRAGAGTMAMHQPQQAQQQYNTKSALKKRSATVAGTTQQQSVANLQMLRLQQQQQQQQHLEQQLLQQQQQQTIYKQHHYHHPQQHLFKQHIEHHQVLMPHLQYATQKFYYTTLQPQTQSQNPQQQQPQYGRYIKNQTLQQHTIQQQHQQQHTTQQQQQQQHQQQQQQSPLQQLQHVPQNAQQQSPTRNQQHHILYTTTNQLTPTHQHQHQPQQQQHQLLLTPPHASASAAAVNIDNISLYSLNSNNVATLHRQAQQQLPIIVQCDKYYLSPTTHHVSHNDGGGFIKSSQNIKEYISPLNSPQHHGVIMARDRILASQTNLGNRGATNTPSMDAISLAPSYVSMETVDYMTSPTTSQQHQQQQQQQPHHPSNMRWRSQTNLPPSSSSSTNMTGDMKSHSSDMLNNNQYYHNNSMNPTVTVSANQPPPQVTQVKPFKPLDEISINSYTSDTQKKMKPKQWMESSLDGPVIRQTTPQHMNNNDNDNHNNNNNIQQTQRPKLSSQSLNTSRHYSMSAAQAKPINSCINNNGPSTKLSQSTSYLNQLEATQNSSASSISQAYNVESTSPQNTTIPQQHQSSYKYLQNQQNNNKQPPPPRPPLYINNAQGSSGNGSQNNYQTVCISPSGGALSIATSPAMAGMSSTSALSPDIRIESPKNMTVVQPATFQPYKEVTKPFEMSDFYKYSTKYRQKENNNNAQPEN